MTYWMAQCAIFINKWAPLIIVKLPKHAYLKTDRSEIEMRDTWMDLDCKLCPKVGTSQKETPTQLLIQHATIVILHLYWVLLRVYTYCAFKTSQCSAIQLGIVKRSFKSHYGIKRLLFTRIYQALNKFQ